MNNMGLFSKSDKDEKETELDKVMRDLEKIKKDKNRDYTHNFQFKSLYGDWSFEITITVSHFGVFLDTILSEPNIQELWNDVKEKFGKEIDEQELLRVFKLYVLIIRLLGVLSETQKMIQSYSWIYDRYNDPTLFNGKLDKVRLIELLEKIVKYLATKSAKNMDEKTDQKDEQPK
jgi:hypothetical protein